MPGKVRIGTSGWIYPHWKGVYYPEDLPQKDWYGHYVRDFDTVEINNTFYRLPMAETFEHWGEVAPKNFLYTFKASRTHIKAEAAAKKKGPPETSGGLYSAFLRRRRCARRRRGEKQGRQPGPASR